MSTFLALAQKLRQEAEIPGTGPSAVTGQTGQLKRVVDWTADAYNDIQRRYPCWKWMRSSFTLATVAGTDTYAYGTCTDTRTAAPIARFSHWWFRERLRPRIYLQSGGVGGEGFLTFLAWDHFQRLYKVGSQTNSTPIHITEDPWQNLVLGPKPNDVYVVSGDFQRGIQALAADGDTPDMPADYHDLIPYYAMEKYGANSVAPEVFQRAVREGGRLMSALERYQLPLISFGNPLA